MSRLSKEIIYWNHFQIRYSTLEEGCKNKGFVTTCQKCEYGLPLASDNKWFFSRSCLQHSYLYRHVFFPPAIVFAIFNMSFCYLLLWSEQFVSAWNSKDVTSSSWRQRCLLFFFPWLYCTGFWLFHINLNSSIQ